MEAAAWGFIGTIVGALASIGTSWLTSRATGTAQREKVELDWRVQHRQFQIKAVTELQEVLGEFARATGRIRYLDEISQGGGQVSDPLPTDDGLSEHHAQLIRQISVLVARIDDTGAREAVNRVRATAVRISTGFGVDFSTMMGFSNEVERAQEALSSCLRAIYGERLASR